MPNSTVVPCFSFQHCDFLSIANRTKLYLSYRSRGGVDDAHAGRWCIVDSLSFLAIGVPDVVHMLLLELVVSHAAFGKLCPPESQGRI